MSIRSQANTHPQQQEPPSLNRAPPNRHLPPYPPARGTWPCPPSGPCSRNNKNNHYTIPPPREGEAALVR